MKTRRGPSEAESKPGKKRKNWFGLLFSPEDADADGKSRETDPFEEWQPGDTCYGWHANGMLAAVRTPEGKTVTFGYDALGRRVSKSVGNGTRRFGWDGNVVLHEWDVDEAGKPKIVTDATGREEYSGTEKPENLVTWVYDGTSFTPVAKVADGERYTIVQDYLGTPTQAYDSRGELVWEMLLDMYGKVTECYGDRTLIPFRFQGMYYDTETDLCYVRHRYYSADTGTFISQDPIGLAGGNPTLYGYVFDSNTEVDIFGLDLHHIIPQEIYKFFKGEFKEVKGYVQNVSKKAKDVTNLIDLDKPFHGNHPQYNKYVKDKVKDLVDTDNLNLKNIRKLQDQMLEHIANAKKSGLNLNDYFKEGYYLKNKIKCR